MQQIMDYYPLTHPQKGRWYIEKFYHGTSINNIGATLILQGEIDYVLLNKAINNFIQRNDGIRLRTAEDLGEPRQYVSDYRPIEFELIDFSDSHDPDELAAWCTKEINKPFQLNNRDLFYFVLIKISENEGGAFVKFHHLIADAWTMTLLGNQVMQCYNALVEGEDIEIAMLPSYIKYLATEDEYIISKRFEKARRSWDERFNNLPELATFKPRTSSFSSSEAKRIMLELSLEETGLIQQYCKQKRLSVFIVMYSAMAAYVSKTTGLDDIVIATMVLNRYTLEEKLTAGMFANPIPIRVAVDDNLLFDDFCQLNKTNWKPILMNQRYPYDLLFKDIMAKHKTNGRLYDILISYQNAKLIRANSVEGYKTQWIFNGHITDPFMMHISDRDDEGQLTIEYDYQTEIFNEEEIIEIHNDLISLLFNAIQNPEKRICELDQQFSFNYLPIPKDLKEELTLRISSSFTAEPIEDYMTWWGRQFGYDLNVEFAAYNQVFQELLDPNSKLSGNTEGINVILARFEDYIRDDHGAETDKLSKLEQVFAEFIQAIDQFPNKVPLIIGQFPVSTHLGLSLSVQNKIEEINLRLAEALASYRNIYLLDLTQLQDIYSIEEAFDTLKDKEGHMPFSDEFYAAMGTEITRKICAIKKQAFKVIVLDCDETLWQGICGEQGAAGVTITEGHKEFQQFLLQKQREGFLLAICSKNNEADVWEVFEKNPGMVLEKKHITAWRINWQEKSQNIRELADDLNLGIDSFIFIDDSAVECTKMVEACPEVLTLQMPTQEDIIPNFLKHVWAFDRVKVTKEDAQRASMYEAEQKRKQIESGTSIDDFIKKLELKVSMRSLADEEIERAAQLTQRTNQFNLSTIRRTEEEIFQLTRDEKYQCFILEAADRFGDYGIIGLVILENKEDNIFIDTFLLSCRVLGRRVEDVVLSGIRRYAKEQGIDKVETIYIATAKNQPILEFIEKGNWIVADKCETSILYKMDSIDLPEKIEHIAFYYEELYETIEKEDNLRMVITVLGLDHVAIAVESQQNAGNYYETIGYSQTNAVYDPLQNSQLSIYHSEDYIPIELVAPYNDASPTYNLVKRDHEIPYHLCYQVNSINEFMGLLSDIDYEVISPEKPAVLFNNNSVAFLMINRVGLIELVEVQTDILPKQYYKRNKIKLVVQDLEKAITFYRLLGYTEEKVTHNRQNNSIVVSLFGLYGETLELISPTDKESSEYIFLSQNGAGVYKIGYGIKETDSYDSKQIIIKPYNAVYEITESKAKLEDLVLHNLAALELSEHKKYLIPLKNSTAIKLMQLPIYKGSIYQNHEYITPRNEMEEKLIAIWEDVLKVQPIGIGDNFFVLGGNSIKVLQVMTRAVKYGWGLTAKDFFKYPTIMQLSELINRTNDLTFDDDKSSLMSKTHCNRHPATQLRLSGEKVDLGPILLTGATGFLGAHMLNELISTTNNTIYCLVRDKSEDHAKRRLTERLHQYFSDGQCNTINKRIVIVRGDCNKPHLGISDEQYKVLGDTIGTVIHSAALVKFYGDWEEFRETNVVGTQNIIEFCSVNGVRLAHISTESVSGNHLVEQDLRDVHYTENDFFVGQNYMGNAYVRSKFEAEYLVLDAIAKGLTASIFRMGLITGRFSDGLFQSNIDENAQYNRLKFLFDFGMIPKELMLQDIEFSPVDLCSQAVIQLMQARETWDKVYHIYNNKYTNVDQLIMAATQLGLKVNISDYETVSHRLRAIAEDTTGSELITRIIPDLTADYRLDFDDNITMDNTITTQYLEQVGFVWPEIDIEYLVKVLRFMIEQNFIG